MHEDIPFSREAKLVYAEAFDIARRAGKPFDSAHIVLGVFTVACEAQSILLEHRTDCERVMDCVRGLEPESPETVTVIYSTAAQIAANVGSRQVTSVHLLLAVSRVTSSRAARLLERTGIALSSLRTRAMAHLTDPRLKRSATERMASIMPPTLAPVVAPWIPAPTLAAVPARPAPGSALAAAPAARAPAPVVYEDESDPAEFVLDEEPRSDEPVRGNPCRPDDAPRDVRGVGAGRFCLDPDRFPVLAGLGRNLTAEAEEGKLDPLVGRADALEAVVDILCKRRSNNPLLLGDPGVGKTALVEGLAIRIVDGGSSVPGLEDKVIVAISVADLVAGTSMRGSFAARLKALKDEVLAADRRVILFIDEIHTLIGAGQGDGAAMDASNDLKGALARGQFPCIGATTFGEYKRYIFPDDALRRRFEPVYLREPSLEEADRILAGVAPRYAEHHHVSFGEDALRAAVRLTDRVIPDRSLPAKAIDLLDRAGARVRREGRAEVGRDDIVNVLSALADVPSDFLALSPSERLRGMERALRERVFGHDDCLGALVRTLAQNWARFGSRRPLGSFVFAGPPGSGRRTTALAVAEYLFGSTSAVLEIDLSDYGEAHALSHLIGSPPGYVGHEEGGLLADALVRRPFLLIAWHHPDQAHASVLGLLHQILSEGTATDRKGRRMDFRNTVHVLALADEATGRPVGFGADASTGTAARGEQATARLRRVLPAELVASVDQCLVFRPLDVAMLERVADRLLREASDSFAEEHGLVLDLAPGLAASLARQAGRGGPAAVEAAITEGILRPASDLVFDRGISEGSTIRVGPGAGPGDSPTVEPATQE